MKTRTSGALAALLLSLVLSASAQVPASPAKRQAFGPIQFGDTLPEAQEHLKLLIDGMNQRKQMTPTVNDALRDFIVPGSKYPPKLAPRYAKTVVSVNMGSKYPLSSIEVKSEQVADEAKIKADWETLRDIANSKFGIPAKTTPFGSAKADARHFAETDIWKFNGLEIRLGIETIIPPKSAAVLIASDPARVTTP